AGRTPHPQPLSPAGRGGENVSPSPQRRRGKAVLPSPRWGEGLGVRGGLLAPLPRFGLTTRHLWVVSWGRGKGGLSLRGPVTHAPARSAASAGPVARYSADGGGADPTAVVARSSAPGCPCSRPAPWPRRSATTAATRAPAPAPGSLPNGTPRF